MYLCCLEFLSGINKNLGSKYKTSKPKSVGLNLTIVKGVSLLLQVSVPLLLQESSPLVSYFCKSHDYTIKLLFKLFWFTFIIFAIKKFIRILKDGSRIT